MTNNPRTPSSISPKRSRLFRVLGLAALAASSACQSGADTANTETRGVVIVNAPATGEVSRVLVREGMSVETGAPIVEIAVRIETPVAAPSPGESAEARAARNFKAADAEIEAARAEAVRHEAEVQRLTPLVASGESSPAQLDGERALYERAAQRLQQAQDAKRKAETGLLAARQPGTNRGTSSAPETRAEIVAARASSPGTVSAISVRVGTRVEAGQPLATLRAGQP